LTSFAKLETLPKCLQQACNTKHDSAKVLATTNTWIEKGYKSRTSLKEIKTFYLLDMTQQY